MKPEQFYQCLKELAEKFDITVSEESFRKDGIRVRSGFCRLKGKKLYILDKHSKIYEKIDQLASFLSMMPHEDLYVVPAVRDLLYKFGKRDKADVKDDFYPE